LSHPGAIVGDMTIIDFPTKARRRSPTHPAAVGAAARARARASGAPAGEPPTGAWLDAYEQLAACCAEVVAVSRPRVYDAEWEDLVSWIRSRLAALDELKASEGVSPLGAS
jgi:hypothetical protein